MNQLTPSQHLRFRASSLALVVLYCLAFPVSQLHVHGGHRHESDPHSPGCFDESLDPRPEDSKTRPEGSSYRVSVTDVDSRTLSDCLVCILVSSHGTQQLHADGERLELTRIVLGTVREGGRAGEIRSIYELPCTRAPPRLC